MNHSSGSNLNSIDRICDEFESGWLKGDPQPIENLISKCNQDDRLQLFEELLSLEIEYRIDANQNPNCDEYMDRFYQFRNIVLKVFERIEGDGSTAYTIAGDTFQESKNNVGDVTNSPPGERFDIVEEYAAGGLGKVFIATDREVKRNVALKKLHGNHNRNQDIRRRFQREANITGALEHPGIVPVYSAGVDHDGAPYYAMRFVSGETLQSAIESFHKNVETNGDYDQIELQKLLRRFLDVCNTIAYAHNKGVVHRDLKPANIILGQFGETQIVDWGMAKRVDDPEEYDSVAVMENANDPDAIETQQGSLMGTPRYMSPEQARGDVSNVSYPSDIYSLGATLYHLLAGKPYLLEKNVKEVIHRVIAGDIPEPRDIQAKIPKPLAAICQKAIQIEPSARYETAKSLADDVESYLANQPVSAYSEPWTKKLSRWTSKHKTAVTGVAVAMVVLLISATVALILVNSAREREQSAKQLAEQRNEQAKLFFRKARLAVDNYLGKIQSDNKLKSEGLNDLRIELLESAEVFYQELAEQQPDDPDLQVDIVIALDKLSAIQKDLGKIDDAQSKLDDARKLAIKLLEKNPNDPVIRSSLVKMNNRLAHIYRLRGKLKEARDLYIASNDWSDGLLESDPKNQRYLFDSVASGVNLGYTYVELNQPDLANAQFDRAEKVFIDNKWSDYDAGFLQANLYKVRARCYANLNQGSKAINYYQKSIDAFKELCDSYPDDLDLAIELANTISDYSQEFRDPKSLKMLSDDFVTRFKPILEKHSNNMELRGAMAVVYRQMAEVLGESAEIPGDEAIDLFMESLELLESIVKVNPGLKDYKKALAYGYYRLGAFCAAKGLSKEMELHQLEAIELYSKLDQAQIDVIHPLAYCSYSVAVTCYSTDRFDKCCELSKKGIPLYIQLCDRLPNNPDVFAQLWSFYEVYYLSLWNSGNRKEAVIQIESAIDFAEDIVEENSEIIREQARQKLNQFRSDLKTFAGNLSD